MIIPFGDYWFFYFGIVDDNIVVLPTKQTISVYNDDHVVVNDASMWWIYEKIDGEEWKLVETKKGNVLVDKTDVYACEIENRIRAEHNLPLRTHYTYSKSNIVLKPLEKSKIYYAVPTGPYTIFSPVPNFSRY